MTRTALATLAMPFAAATMIGGILVATHHTTVPPLTPQATSPGPSQSTASVPCERAGLREPFAGIGKPEPLRHILQGCCSRRIDDEHRLVYLVDGDDLVILQARYHYEP